MTYKSISIKNILDKLENDEELTISEHRFFEKWEDDQDFQEMFKKPSFSNLTDF